MSDSLTLDWKGSSGLSHQHLLFMMLLTSIHLHLMTQWLCRPTAAFLKHTHIHTHTHTHSAVKAALWKPTRLPLLAQTLQNQCVHMEMFPLVGINLVQGWKKKESINHEAAQKIHNRKNLEKFSHDPETPLTEKTLSPSLWVTATSC